nr:PREDICTED: coiled-coil domain-containing protein 96 [Anolis carolinensis]|eukprot:XP_008107282.1 PREDICTED: coiled-coil domain-containing protein 96 [Anolis carolinensis]
MEEVEAAAAEGEAAVLTGPEPEKEEEKAEEAKAVIESSSEAEVPVAVVVASPPPAEEQEAALPEASVEKGPDGEPPPAAEGEAEAEGAAVEGKAEGVPEGGGALEGPEQEGKGELPAPERGEEEVKEEEPKPPEEAAPSEEAPPEEKPAGEGEGEGEGTLKEILKKEGDGEGEKDGGKGESQPAAEEESQEPSPTLLLPQPAKPELPTSVTFAEGEAKEPSLLLLGADLGQRISQSLWELDKIRGPSAGSTPESTEALSPERETEEQLVARRAEEQRRREELTEEFWQLQAERRRLRNENIKLQAKLAELLGRSGKEGAPRAAAASELEQHISDREQRYSRYLAMLEELRAQQVAEGAWYQRQLEALHNSCQEKLGKVQAEWQACQATKKEVAVFTMGRRLGGKQAAKKEVDQIQVREQAKEDEMTEVRLEYINLKHKIQKLEAKLKAQEELAEGLHLIDFEQLKIENQTYNEKIEERNEELLKLRRKITNTVQIISQVKEKLQFVEAENQVQKSQLMAVEALVAQKREILTKTKQARDKLRLDNERLQQKCGLLGHSLLLRDYENKVNAAEALKERLEILKRRHAGLSLSCKGVKKKLEGVTSFLPL